MIFSLALPEHDRHDQELWNIAATKVYKGDSFCLHDYADPRYCNDSKSHIYALEWFVVNGYIKDFPGDFGELQMWRSVFFCLDFCDDYSDCKDALGNALKLLVAAGMNIIFLPGFYRYSPHALSVTKLLLVDFEVPFPMSTVWSIAYPSFYNQVLPLIYDKGIKLVGPQVFEDYKGRYSDRLKMAILRNRHDVVGMPFRDREMELYFKRLENRVVALCDHLPVDVVMKVATCLRDFRCLHTWRVVRRMEARQALAHTVVNIE